MTNQVGSSISIYESDLSSSAAYEMNISHKYFKQTNSRDLKKELSRRSAMAERDLV